MNYIYKNIRYLRNVNKLTLDKMSALVKVNPSTISRWENNEMGITIDNAIEISKKFNIPIDNLICKDLSIKENVILDEKHVLDNMIVNKTYQMSDQDKKMLIGIIDSINNNVENK